MRKVIFFAFFICLAVISTTYAQNYPITSGYWEGARWSSNISQGSWFPTVDSVAHFGINNTSWGQLRTIDTISKGSSVTFNTQISLSSSGLAYFGFGDQYVGYSGSGMGICFDHASGANQIRIWYRQLGVGGDYPILLDT